MVKQKEYFTFNEGKVEGLRSERFFTSLCVTDNTSC